MKSICKLVLVVFLFTTVAFADGDLPNGNRSCPNGATTCFAAGDTTEPDTKTIEETTDTEDSALTLVQKYLDSVYDYFATQE
jgi:hypothetical protein